MVLGGFVLKGGLGDHGLVEASIIAPFAPADKVLLGCFTNPYGGNLVKQATGGRWLVVGPEMTPVLLLAQVSACVVASSITQGKVRCVLALQTRVSQAVYATLSSASWRRKP